MADFDAIYPEETEPEENIEETHVTLVPDPIVVRGAGNMTVYVSFYQLFTFNFINNLFTICVTLTESVP